MYTKVVFLLFALFATVFGKVIQVKNVAREDLWVEFSDRDGFLLTSGQFVAINVDDSWTGSISAKSANCQLNKCDSLVRTLAEFDFNVGQPDKYDVSLLNGFNRNVKISPIGGINCRVALCAASINDFCPTTHQVRNEQDVVFGCQLFPELFRVVCPLAISSATDNAVFNCQTNTYIVILS